MAIFQDNLGKPVPECHHFGFYCSKDDKGDGDNWSYKTCKAPVNLSTSTHFLQAWCPSYCPTNSVRALKGVSMSLAIYSVKTFSVIVLPLNADAFICILLQISCSHHCRSSEVG